MERSYLDICLPIKFHYPALNDFGVVRFQASVAVRMKSLLMAKTWLWYFFCLINLPGCHTDIITGYLKNTKLLIFHLAGCVVLYVGNSSS